jgi:DNA-binding transcriptional ArsR family regulator
MHRTLNPQWPLDALRPKTRQAILAATLMNPDRWWYMSDLAKHVGRTPSSLQRDLAALAEAEILRRRREGNRAYFQADRDCPLFEELRGILTKTAGLVDGLREALGALAPRIMIAYVYGPAARGGEPATRGVDVLAVGDIGPADLGPAVRFAAERLHRPVNPTVLTPIEFMEKAKAGDGFLQGALGDQKLLILGNRRTWSTLVRDDRGLDPAGMDRNWTNCGTPWTASSGRRVSPGCPLKTDTA